AEWGEGGRGGAKGLRTTGAANCVEFGGRSVELSLVSAVQEHGDAVGGEPEREGFTQAVSGAGDEDGLWAGHRDDPGSWGSGPSTRRTSTPSPGGDMCCSTALNNFLSGSSHSTLS